MQGDQLVEVFKNGKLIVEEYWPEIRKRLNDKTI